MKKNFYSITFLLITFFFSVSMFVNAQEITNKTILQHNSSNNRPCVRGLRGKPARLSTIQCDYSSEYICFELPADADFMEVTITDAHGMTWTGIATQDEPCCDIPPMASPAQIECTVDMTATFTGTLVF